jgi:methyltransferase, FkbM family
VYLEHLISPKLAIFAAPRCFLRRLIHPDLVSFGLLANLNGLKRRGLFKGIDGIIDVGANIGQFAFMAHLVWPHIPIYSFEPDKECFVQLESNFKRYSIPGDYFQIALSDQPGVKKLFIYDSRANNSFLKRYDSEKLEVNHIDVITETLDGFKEKLSITRMPLLKIDVQGFELSVIHGARDLIKRCKYVILEVSFQHSYQGNAHVADIFLIMRDNGFSCFEILDILRMSKAEGKGMREADLLFVNDNLKD